MRASLVITICMAATASCKDPVNAPRQDRPGSTIEVEAQGVSGVIFTAEAMGETIGWPEVERWTPTVEDALRADAIARQCVKEKAPEVHGRYDEYSRQYVGYLQDGRRLVFINYFIERSDFAYWKKKLVRVKDGGSNYFEVRVDLASGTCVQVTVHGEA